jgi:hypothetical protein
MSTEIGVWVAAFFTIGIASFLYKDNPLYKFCESVFVGISAGYWAVSLFWENLIAKMFDSVGISYMFDFWSEKGALQDIFSGAWNEYPSCSGGDTGYHDADEAFPQYRLDRPLAPLGHRRIDRGFVDDNLLPVQFLKPVAENGNSAF